MQIRSYQQGDVDAVWELHVLALQHVGAYKGSGSWDNDLYHIEERYIANGGVFLVGVLDNRIVTMGALRKSDEERAEYNVHHYAPLVSNSTLKLPIPVESVSASIR